MKKDIIIENVFGFPIRRDSDTGLYCATDLADIAKRYAEYPVNLSQFMSGEKFKKIAREIHKDKPVVRVGRGRSSGTWVHPVLLIYIGCNIERGFSGKFCSNVVKALNLK